MKNFNNKLTLLMAVALVSTSIISTGEQQAVVKPGVSRLMQSLGKYGKALVDLGLATLTKNVVKVSAKLDSCLPDDYKSEVDPQKMAEDLTLVTVAATSGLAHIAALEVDKILQEANNGLNAGKINIPSDVITKTTDCTTAFVEERADTIISNVVVRDDLRANSDAVNSVVEVSIAKKRLMGVMGALGSLGIIAVVAKNNPVFIKDAFDSVMKYFGKK